MTGQGVSTVAATPAEQDLGAHKIEGEFLDGGAREQAGQEPAQPASCCAPQQQASCCEPAEKASCCGTAASGTCGCRVGGAAAV